jgi:hypothetical protein
LSGGRRPAHKRASSDPTPDRDYRYRTIVPKNVWAHILAELAQEQQWSNFKNEVNRYQGRVGADYVHALHEVWGIMYAFQNSEPAEPTSEINGKTASKSSNSAVEKLIVAVRKVYGISVWELTRGLRAFRCLQPHNPSVLP